MEHPETDSSEEGLLERLGNALVPEAPVEEAIEASQEDVDDTEQPEEAETEEVAEEPGLVELELEDGRTVKVPAEAKDGYLRQSDYTRKTQELSMLAKTAQSTLQQQAIVSKFQTETQTEQRRLDQIESELSRLKSVDWTQYDTDTLMKTRVYMDNLRDEAGDLKQKVEGKKQQVFGELEKLQREATRSAYDYISRHVKDWSAGSQTEEAVAKYAENYGIAPEVLGSIARMYPGFAVLAHKASQYDRLQVSKGQAVQKAQKAPPVVKPGAVTSTNAAQAKQVQDQRSRLKKSGDYRDAIALMSKFVR